MINNDNLSPLLMRKPTHVGDQYYPIFNNYRKWRWENEDYRTDYLSGFGIGREEHPCGDWGEDRTKFQLPIWFHGQDVPLQLYLGIPRTERVALNRYMRKMETYDKMMTKLEDDYRGYELNEFANSGFNFMLGDFDPDYLRMWVRGHAAIGQRLCLERIRKRKEIDGELDRLEMERAERKAERERQEAINEYYMMLEVQQAGRVIECKK